MNPLSERTAIVDASLVIEAMVGDSKRQQARRLLAEYTLRAPAHIGLEVASALARLERSQELPSVDTNALIATWRGIPVETIGLELLMEDAWGLRSSLRIADAFYAAAAIRLKCPLLTADARLARAAIPGLAVLLIS